jgi:hypothetical protein
MLTQTLLSITEMGGYPDFSVLYQQAGYAVAKENTMRKALAWLKNKQPQVIIAEFIFAPKHGLFISNVDSLFSLVASKYPETRIILFVYPEENHHLEKLHRRYTDLIQLNVLFHPIQIARLSAFL